MKLKPVWQVIIGLLCFWPLAAHTHGVTGTVDRGGLAVTARYDSGEPMNYARVKISSPKAEHMFQSGRTDKNGRFCFFPDAAGDWEVVIDDEMGHRLEVEVPVDEQLAWKEVGGSLGSGGSAFTQYQKAILGVFMLLGLFGIFGWIKKKGK